MPDSAITSNYSKQLCFFALLLLPLAYIADCALDAWMFKEETLARQIFHPTMHELALRGLFSVFIVLIAVLAIHFLWKSTRLERALRTRNENLLLANRELEAFNYALSHELRNSLTIIYTSMEMLRDHCQIGKNTQCHYLLSTICKYSEKMETQIECMLLLANTPGSDIHREVVLLDDLAREILDEILQNKTSRPVISIEPGLQAECNRSMIRMALGNLLSNAVKFLADNRPGEIQVGKEQQGEETVFFIRDNGTGFDSAQSEVLFEGFSRLSSGSSLPGTGIGLATTRRIIKRHGGRIWTEGTPNQGATFYFTLPTT